MIVKKYKVEFSYKALHDFEEILKHLSKNKKQQLINLLQSKIQLLEFSPWLYPKIEKSDELGRIFRKIVLKQYVIFYTIDEEKNKLYISHIFYNKSNYFNKL